MDAYPTSTVVRKLRHAKQQREPLRLAFIDIDGTWAGAPAHQQHVRNLLEEHHYTIGQVTSRPSLMSVRQSMSQQSRLNFQGLLDPDILIANTGTEMFIKQVSGSYQPDTSYLQRLPASSQAWRPEVEKLIEHYRQAESAARILDVALVNFRVEVKMDSRQSAENLRSILQQHPNASTMHITRDNQSLLITPAHTSKEHALAHVLTTLLKTVPAAGGDLHLLIAGDSAAEVEMGFFGGPASNVTFLVVGGSSLYGELRAGEFLPLYQQMTKSQDNDILTTGVYWFPKTARTIILGNEAFPGTLGPQTLIAWLRQHS